MVFRICFGERPFRETKTEQKRFVPDLFRKTRKRRNQYGTSAKTGEKKHLQLLLYESKILFARALTGVIVRAQRH